MLSESRLKQRDVVIVSCRSWRPVDKLLVKQGGSRDYHCL